MTERTINVVIPCYRSEKTLAGVVREAEAAIRSMDGFRSRIILVNDGSPDGTWEVIRALAAEKPNRIGIGFSRNFGQHAALMAGIREACGGMSSSDYVVCLDDDGQTPANEMGKLIEALEQGADAVYARYANKQHSRFRNFGSAVNEKMCEVLLEKPRDLYVSSYVAMRAFVAQEVIRYQNAYPYLLGLVLRSTSNIVNVDVVHRAREEGSSGYTLKKLFGLWMNGFTAFSVKPLRIATFLGCIFAGLGFLYGVYTILKKLFNPTVPMGFSALMTAVIFFGGMLMLMVGLAGEYIGRTYISVSQAPQYVIREKVIAGDEKTEE